MVRTNLRLHQAGGTRKDHVRRGRADDDEVDVRGCQSGAADGLAGRFGGEVRCRDAGIDDVPLADASPLQDPFIRGLDQPLEVGVGEQPRWNECRKAGDTGAAKAARDGMIGYHSPEPLPGAVSPKYSYARAVATRPRGVRSRKPA